MALSPKQQARINELQKKFNEDGKLSNQQAKERDILLNKQTQKGRERKETEKEGNGKGQKEGNGTGRNRKEGKKRKEGKGRKDCVRNFLFLKLKI